MSVTQKFITITKYSIPIGGFEWFTRVNSAETNHVFNSKQKKNEGTNVWHWKPTHVFNVQWNLQVSVLLYITLYKKYHGVSKNERFSFEIQSKWLIRKKTGEKMLHVEINGSSKSNEPDEKHWFQQRK